MRWTQQYCQIPYKAATESHVEGVDCWRLVRMIQREQYGIELPSLDEYNDPDDTQKNIAIFYNKDVEWRAEWKEVFDPQVGDVVVFILGGLPCHVGVVLKPPTFIHAVKGIGVCVENYNRPKFAKRVESFWRHCSRA